MPTDSSHIVLEMIDEPDCRFIGSWLITVAEAQTLWSEALQDSEFKDRVFALCAFCEPHLECGALDIFAELARCRVLATDLYAMEADCFSIEFGMMVQLGFFAFNGRSYQMTVPKEITLASVQQAALSVLSTEDETEDCVEAVQPERLLHTLPKSEAEALRSRLIEMRRFNADDPRDWTEQ